MEQGLKQRIIGAVVLVIAAVIFLPMLLSEQDETVQVEVEVPAAPVMDDSDMLSALPPTLPEPAPVPEITAPRVQAERVTPPVVVAPAQVAPPAEPAPVPEPPTAPPAAEVTAPTTPPASSAPAIGGWVVQQGSFSSAANAESFRQTLAGQGYNAYTRVGQSAGKEIVRVYVGPLNSREAAVRVRDELERRHSSKGLVVAHDESTRAP